MNIRESHIGTISRCISDTEDVEIDAGALVRRLILFEHCTLESDLLREVPTLIRVFGVAGFKDLIESKALSIVCDFLTMGSIGQHPTLQATVQRGGPLPLGSYRIVPLLGVERKKYLHKALQSVHDVAGMDLKGQIKLKGQLVPLLGEYPSEISVNSRASFLERVADSDSVVHRALEIAFREAAETALPKGVYVYTEDFDNDGDFRVMTNLAERTSLSREEVHKIVERALLGVAGIEQRLQVMSSFSAVSGFRIDEIPLFEERLELMGAQLDPSAQERRFERVVAVGGLPGLDDLPRDQTIDVTQLLKLRASAECCEFRAWLREIDKETDGEIEKRFASMRERVSRITHTKGAKVIRFLLGEAVRVVPIYGLAAGPAFSATDKFVADKLVGEPGPVTFISKKYPSIFEDVRVPLSELMEGPTHG
jgi:hypothetical protein